LTIGPHGSPWTPEKARTEAKRLLGQIADGIDPANLRDAAKRSLTVSELVERYFDQGVSHKRETTLYVERGMAKRHIEPLLGRRMVESLRRSDIERFKADIAAGKTAGDHRTGPRGLARVRGGKGAANRTVALLAAMLSFAFDQDICTDNPATKIRHFKLPPRVRYLSSAELTRLGEALARAEAAGENVYGIFAIRLLILTGARKTEILSLRWEWVDFENRQIRLPTSKTGAKAISLGAPALELLAGIPRDQASPYVFPSTVANTHYVGLPKVWRHVRDLAKLEGVRLHDLRHSFASVGASSGDSLYVIGKLLGHTQQRTTEKYAHLSDDPVRAAADRISGKIAAAMIPTDLRSNVVNLKPGG
jgi:integrase